MKNRIKFAIFFCALLGCLFYPGDFIQTSSHSLMGVLPSVGKVADFPHSKHKLACSSCHKFPSSNWKAVKRNGESFPDVTEYPRHESCLSCHRKQFFGSGTRPTICSICHVNPGPRDSRRHPFPNPRELFDLSPKGKAAASDFAVSFAHDKHIDIVSQYPNKPDVGPFGTLFVKAGMKRFAEESCKVCHQTYKPQGDSKDEYFTPPPKDLGDAYWLKKGTFKTVPTGHTVCFTCHSTDTGISPVQSECGTCHKLKPVEKLGDFDPKVAAKMSVTDKIMMSAWKKRDSAAAFRHEYASHADLECANCHNVKKINTLEAATKKVDILSCAVCHITATADDGGVLNFEVDARKKDAKFQCAKCHIAYGRMPIPDSHINAIKAQQ